MINRIEKISEEICREPRCLNCMCYISGGCGNGGADKAVCKNYDELPIVQSRNDFTGFQVVAALKKPAFSQVIENILQYVSVQGHTNPCEDYEILNSLLEGVVEPKEVAAYIAYLHNGEH